MKSKGWIGVLVVILALGLVVPSIVQAQNNSEQPGSVIVFPKFIRGTVLGGTVPASEFEISAVCPRGVVCTPNQAVRIKLEWVCPGSATRPICKETDFFLTTTVNGTVVFNPNGGLAPIPPRAPCATGFLIGWVVDGSGVPIRFDGLIGDAVIRNGGASAGAYNGIPIQAVPGTGPITDPLTFDGVAGHYQALSPVALSSLRYDTLTPAVACGATGQVSNVCTYLTMLTLDILSNRINDSTYVDFVFFNAAEQGISTSTDFICWAEQELTTDIDSNLDVATLGRKGLMVARGSDQLFANRTLLVLVETLEFGATGTAPEREYSYSTFNDGTVVGTRFRP